LRQTIPTIMNAPSLTLCICVLATQSAFPDDEKLYTQRGSDPTFEEIIKSGKLPQGRNSTNGKSAAARPEAAKTVAAISVRIIAVLLPDQTWSRSCPAEL